MKKTVFLIACLTVCYSVPINLNATIWNYSVNGTLKKSNDQQIFNVCGHMIIDDTLRLWIGGPPSPPAPLGLKNAQFSYFIPEYSLTVNEYSFFGSAGSFYMERSDFGMGDLMWFLDYGCGNWTNWTGEHFHFFHENMTPYDLFNEWNQLAPIIQLTCLDYLFYDPILGGCENICTDIVLERNHPVPEPTTMLLLGAGLAGFAGFGRKRFKK